MNDPYDDLNCPISGQLFYDPVVAEDFNIYEREVIEKWFKIKNISPLTNVKIGNNLISSHSTKLKVEQFLKNNPDKISEQYIPQDTQLQEPYVPPITDTSSRISKIYNVIKKFMFPTTSHIQHEPTEPTGATETEPSGIYGSIGPTGPMGATGPPGPPVIYGSTGMYDNGMYTHLNTTQVNFPDVVKPTAQINFSNVIEPNVYNFINREEKMKKMKRILKSKIKNKYGSKCGSRKHGSKKWGSTCEREYVKCKAKYNI